MFACNSKVANRNQQETYKFEKLVFHATRCFGTCPAIDLQVDSNRNIFIRRQVFKNRSETDESLSGDFSGKLDTKQYEDFLQILLSSHYDTLHFPDVFCCDGSVTTIIVYHNGQRKYLKSMFPPPEATTLIQYLKQLALETSLPRSATEIKLEE
jgi:hypothetical protein